MLNLIEQSINDLMRPFNLFTQTKNIEHLFTLYTMTHNLDEIFEKENNDFITLFYLQLQTLTNGVFEKGNT